MDEMFLFYKNSLLNNLCNEYSTEWNSNKLNKEGLFNLSMRQQSLPYMATSTFSGWGLSIDYIYNEFNDYINGKYIAKNCDDIKGYTYERYCKYDKNIDIRTDITDIMNCNSIVSIELTKCPVLYINNNSNIKIHCNGFNSLRIYIFDKSEVTLEDIPEDSNILIYKYSKDCIVNKSICCLGEVKEFNKEIRL